MPRIRLTKASVEGAEGRPDKQLEFLDNKVAPLALRVSSLGKKTWTIRYRTGDGAQRRLSLGNYPAVSLSAARGMALATLTSVARGGDPVDEAKRAKAAAKAKRLSTVDDLVEAYFSDATRGRHKPNGRPKRASTLDMERSYYERLVRPRFGKLPVSELSRVEFQRFLDSVGEISPSPARQCRSVIRQAYNYALRRDAVDKNPAQFAETQRPHSRERVLSDEELRRVWHAAIHPADVEALRMSAATGLAICLAIVTLQRGGEVCGLNEAELNRTARTWTIPGERTKNHLTHVVPLSALAMSIIDRAFAIGESVSGFAFPSPRADKPMTRHAFSRATKRLTETLQIDDATPHDFRRTGATNMTSERMGFTRFVVSRVLNQISDTGGAAAVTSVYDRNEYLAEKRRALDAWAIRVEDIRNAN